MVADTLSRKSESVLVDLTVQQSIVKEFRWLDLEVICSEDTTSCYNIVEKSTLLERLEKAQLSDSQCMRILQELEQGVVSEFGQSDDSILRFRNK
ncbi:hypothetical protein U1Q18_041664, partial [Sarracenia purpurea var. burkii]